MLNKRRLPSMTALQCFEAVARHLSFTRAAEELSLTQSAMSKQVAQLEEQLQHALFRRVRKRLQLTPAGELYLAEVRRILQQVELSTRFLLSYGGETEVLRVATPPTFGARWLIPQLNGWRHRHPNIHLDLRQELEPDDLRQGHCDLAFFFGPGTLPGAECTPVRRTTGGGLRAIPAAGRRTGRTDPTGGAGAAAERQPRGGLARLVRQPGAKLPGLLPRSTLRHLHVHPRRPGRLRGPATALPGRGGTRRRQAGDRLAARPAQPGGLLPGLSRACRGSPQGAPFHRVDGRAPGAGATLSGPRQTRHGPV